MRPSEKAIRAAEDARAKHQLGVQSSHWDDAFFTESMRIALKAAYAIDHPEPAPGPSIEEMWWL